MPRVIQIRDVPDEIHHALASAARAQGLSLNRYLLGEMDQLAGRAQVVRSNAEVIRQTQARVRGDVSRSAILEAVREGRAE